MPYSFEISIREVLLDERIDPRVQDGLLRFGRQKVPGPGGRGDHGAQQVQGDACQAESVASLVLGGGGASGR
jgi:hypothetical protein